MKFRLVSVIVGLMSMCACAGHPVNTRPVSQTFAKYAFDGLSGVELVENAVIAGEGSGVIKTEIAAEVMKGAYKSGAIGKRLAAGLREFDKLSAAVQATPAAQAPILALIAELEASLHDVAGVKVGDATQAQITQLVMDVFSIVHNLKSALAALKTTAVLQPFQLTASVQTPHLRTHALLAEVTR